MAFRRHFSDDCNYTAPSFSDVVDDFLFGPRGIFPVSRECHAEPELPTAAASRKPIPIHIDGPDTEPERKAKGRRLADLLGYTSMAKAAAPASAAVVEQRRAPPSAEAAAVMLQAAARGFLARRSVRAVREVERKAGTVEYVVRQRGEELRGNQRARVAVGEALMGLLLRLDAVRGAREYRRRVARKVLALQDAVDVLEPKAAPAAGEATAEEEDEVAEESAVDGETDHAAEAEPEPDGANPDDDSPDVSDADAEWEMVKVEEPAAPAAAACPEALRHEPAGKEIAGAAGDGAGVVDTGKLMEMVAALCERNAEQCALIGALAERVDALERTVRRMEDAERRG